MSQYPVFVVTLVAQWIHYVCEIFEGVQNHIKYVTLRLCELLTTIAEYIVQGTNVRRGRGHPALYTTQTTGRPAFSFLCSASHMFVCGCFAVLYLYMRLVM